jgi:hypothetical protein
VTRLLVGRRASGFVPVGKGISIGCQAAGAAMQFDSDEDRPAHAETQ